MEKKAMTKPKPLQIRNNTIDFLTLTRQSGGVWENLACANFAQVADNGKTYQYKFYGLKAVIAV
ncbi:hypothetical protein [Treponema sp. UBA3813]|uniref:hypothetical protein n=1 Tax=Treponema sp. UBA3813 TaxID=1947715 RepID=UPI0025E3B85A|nr:hypothetical protein [Treponema sp. UBA3813]